MGLAITKGFIEALNGSIRLNSMKGKGSEFIVEIPLQDAQEEDNQTPVDHPGSGQQNLEGISVLLVDDDPVQLTMTSEMLAMKKVKVVTEMNPDKVLPLLQSTSFDIMFVDIQMPGTDGLMLVEKIRRTGGRQMRNVPIIGLSAREDISREKMKSSGFTGFLNKPFTPGRLYSTIYDYVKRGDTMEDALSDQKQSFGEKGAMALIEFVKEDKPTSHAILQSFIDETTESRNHLQKALQKNDLKQVQAIAHKTLPLFRLMGNKRLVSLIERLEKGETISNEEKDIVLHDIDAHLREAMFLKRKTDEE